MRFGNVIRSAPAPYVYATGIGGTKDTIWHCDYFSDHVYELSVSDFSVVRSRKEYDTPIDPQGIGGDDNTIWCTSGYDYDIFELSTSNLSVIRSRSSPDRWDAVRGIGGDANTIWYCSRFYVYKLSTSNLGVIRRTSAPTGFAEGIGGNVNVVWYSNISNSNIYELSTIDFSVMRSAPVGSFRGIGGNVDVIWACNGSTVYELDPGWPWLHVGDEVLLLPICGTKTYSLILPDSPVNIGDKVKVYQTASGPVAVKESWSVGDKITLQL